MKLDLKRVEYVLFDWDNTLAESRSTLVYVVNIILKKYHLDEWDKQKDKRDPNLSFRDNFPNVFGKENAEKAYEEYRKLYKETVASKISRFDKTLETIELLKQKNIKIIILTNKDRKLLDFELPLLYDVNLFDEIVAGHEAPKDKPYPEQAWYALRNFISPKDITQENVWVVGDSAMDSDCAKAINALPIRVGKPIWQSASDIKEADGIKYFPTFKDFYLELKKSDI